MLDRARAELARTRVMIFACMKRYCLDSRDSWRSISARSARASTPASAGGEATGWIDARSSQG